MASEPAAFSFSAKQKARLRQPPLGLRHVDPRASRLRPLTDDDELYPFAASVWLFKPEVGLDPTFRRVLFDHLWHCWPKSTRGPIGNTESDEDAADARRHGVPLDDIAAELCITKKAAAAKVRRGETELTYAARYGRRVRSDRPWEAPDGDAEAVYIVTGEAALAALDVDDPQIVLPHPDPELLLARSAVDRTIAEGGNPSNLGRHHGRPAPSEYLEQWWATLRRAVDELLT